MGRGCCRLWRAARLSCRILSCFSFFDCTLLGKGAAVHGGEAGGGVSMRGKAVHRWPMHSGICLQPLRPPLPSCRLLSASLPACQAPGQGVWRRSVPRHGASERAGVSLWGWELFSSSPSSRERFHCVTMGWPSRRALSLRHLCVGLGRHRTSLHRPWPLRSPSEWPAGGLFCPQGLLPPVSVPSCGTGGRAAAAPDGHGCCRAEGAVESVSVEAVSGGF